MRNSWLDALVKILALCSLLYRNCLTLEVRIDDYSTLVHVAHILEVDLATCIREEVDLVRLIDASAKGFVIVKGLLAIMSPETLSAYVVSVLGIR